MADVVESRVRSIVYSMFVTMISGGLTALVTSIRTTRQTVFGAIDQAGAAVRSDLGEAGAAVTGVQQDMNQILIDLGSSSGLAGFLTVIFIFVGTLALISAIMYTIQVLVRTVIRV